jgi:membrane-associated phospholipid phosphatase
LGDIILWGMIIPSAFGAPAISGYHYSDHLLINMQVFAATGIITGAAKYIFARQRPYAYFHVDAGSEKYKDNLSFFSGHSAFAFATATTTSVLLQKKYHNISGLIWSSTLTLAATTGILRIAADRHYMSDVLGGAIIGTLTAYLIVKNQKKRILEKKTLQKTILFNWSFAL